MHDLQVTISSGDLIFNSSGSHKVTVPFTTTTTNNHHVTMLCISVGSVRRYSGASSMPAVQ